VERHPARQVGRDGGEDVTSLEGPAHGVPVVAGQGRGHRGERPPLEEEPQEPVVGAHEVVAVGGHGQGAARTADSGVDHRQVHRAGREEAIGVRQQNPGLPHVLGRHAVGQIDHSGPRVYPEHDALHDPDIRVVEPEVRQERHDPARPRRRGPRRPPPRPPPGQGGAGEAGAGSGPTRCLAATLRDVRYRSDGPLRARASPAQSSLGEDSEGGRRDPPPIICRAGRRSPR
jgi:hypothetical protein